MSNEMMVTEERFGWQPLYVGTKVFVEEDVRSGISQIPPLISQARVAV